MSSAQPAYLKDADTHEAAPGHRFGLYYAGWNATFGKDALSARDALRSIAGPLPQHSRQLLVALTARQAAAALEADVFSYPAIASAPFATGLGNEHPLENGFSFLSPYGLPYLPGSGVKGVIRRAAEELLSGEWNEDAQGWSAEAIRALFGPGEEDPTRDSHPQQGALRFWDVFPTPPIAILNDKPLLSVEIMTPHHSSYYQNETTPNTSEAPTPINFLAVVAEARFTFYVECNTTRLNPELQANWRALIEAAFTHAEKWLGFGAKTAVGYGRMRENTSARDDAQKRQEERAASQRKAEEEEQKRCRLDALTPFERGIETLLEAKPKEQSELKALFNALKNKHWQGEEAQKVAQRLQTLMHANKQWREKTEKKRPEKDEPFQMTLFIKSVLNS